MPKYVYRTYLTFQWFNVTMVKQVYVKNEKEFNVMLKKITALGLAATSLAFGFSFAKAAPVTYVESDYTASNEEIAARIQEQEMRKYRRKNNNYTMFKLQAKIKKNEAEIKRLEKKKNKLEARLDRKLRAQENENDRFERERLEWEIEKISREIRLNENKLNDLKNRRSNLDSELATLLQLREI